MARPNLPLGTAGKTRFYGSGKSWRARALYRDFDGVTREVERSGSSKSAAERALKEAIRDRVRIDTTAEINPDSKMSIVAEAWWVGFSILDKSPGTKRLYRDRLDNQVLPALGNLRCREMSTGIVERFLRAVETRHGPSIAKATRSVLSNVCGFAARHDAMDRNPVRDTSPISVKPKKGVAKALTVEQVRLLRALLSYDDRAVGRDIITLIDVLACTGLRLGEALALVWDAADLESGTLEVRGTVIRIKGQGLVIKAAPKSEAGYRTLVLPGWCVEALRSRREAVAGDFVFPSTVGTLRDPANVDDMLKDAFTAAGFPDITSHVFRKSVATMMDDDGQSARRIADQLGHARPSLTQDVYMARKIVNSGAAVLLSALAFDSDSHPSAEDQEGLDR